MKKCDRVERKVDMESCDQKLSVVMMSTFSRLFHEKHRGFSQLFFFSGSKINLIHCRQLEIYF